VNDILHALTAERTRFSTLGELTTGLTLAREFNRNFKTDTWNVNSVVGLRYRFR